MSTPFRTDLADLEFLVFDQLQVPQVLGSTERYGELDRETYRATFQEAARLAAEVLHPLNGPGDKQGCRLDADGNVTTPDGYKEAWQRMVEGGWVTPDAPIEFGGVGLPHVAHTVVNNILISASTAFMMYAGLTSAAARTVEAFGDASYRELVATKLFTGEWSGTMCLTESGAGSSVGDNRAKATPTEEAGVYQLEGEKIFISGGDTDMVENIIHLVLARTPGAPEGTKGLSLFMVPKYEFDEDGVLGRRNGAKVVGIEHKMGIHGSSTCTLALGSESTCKGWLIGQECGGISHMFKMMNEARIAVAGQGAAAACAAYGFAVQYANERVQGTELSRRGEGGPVTIVHHPDVRRMLMTLKVTAETARAACVRMGLTLDRIETSDDSAEKAALQGRADLLIPVLKAHCTDLGYEMATLAVQVYGGYGYISEYPVEQLVRDAKIQSIYEGTNGIQALDLLGRKMRMDDGALFLRWIADTRATLQAGAQAGFPAQAGALGKVLESIGAAAQHLGKVAATGDMDGAFLYAVPFLKAMGVLELGLEALEQARVAKERMGELGETPLLRSKVLGLDFYVAHLLPPAVAHCKTVLSGDRSCLDPALFGL